jgi:hypothetical protein
MNLNMKKYLIFGLILIWAILFCSIIVYWAKQKIDIANSEFTKLNETQTYLIVDSLGNYRLSQLENTVIPVVFYPLQLQFGDISLSVSADTINQQILYYPQNLALFKNACIAHFGESNPKDSTANWLSCKSKLEQLLKPEIASLANVKEWKNFVEEKKIGLALIKHLQNYSGILISGKNIISVKTLNIIENKNYQLLIQNKINTESVIASQEEWLLVMGLILVFIWGIWLLLKYGMKVRNVEQSIENEVLRDDNFDKTNIEDTSEINGESQFWKLYADGFDFKYSSFFEDLQKIPIQPSLGEKAKIKQDLVEMGLHAYSLIRAYRMNNLNNSGKEPNLLLITGKKSISELPSNLYREFIDDPEKMEKRFLILKKVIEEMGIKSMGNALISDVYINEKSLSNL